MFIVLEGLDGAGKSTQIAKLKAMFLERGVESEYLHFPRFDAPVYGDLIARFFEFFYLGSNTGNDLLSSVKAESTINEVFLHVNHNEHLIHVIPPADIKKAAANATALCMARLAELESTTF